MQIVINDIFSWGHMVSHEDRQVLAPALVEATRELRPQPPKEVVIYQTAEDALE